MASSDSSLPLPKGWALTQLAVHEEAVDNTGGVPFAGTIMCQIRLDAGGTAPADQRAADLALFKKSYTAFRMVEQSELRIGVTAVPQVTYTLVEPDHQQTLTQMVAYFRRGSDLYMLTATHRAGPAFDRVKARALELLGTLLAG